MSDSAIKSQMTAIMICIMFTITLWTMVHTMAPDDFIPTNALDWLATNSPILMGVLTDVIAIVGYLINKDNLQ